MASNFSQKRIESDNHSLTPIIKAIIVMLSKNEGFRSLIDQGYTHWQISSGLRDAVNNGFVIRKDDQFFPAPTALEFFSRKMRFSSKKPLEPLHEFRVEKLSKNRSYEPGRQALEQIKNRVRT